MIEPLDDKDEFISFQQLYLEELAKDWKMTIQAVVDIVDKQVFVFDLETYGT